MYNYEEIKKDLFTDDGQRMFLKIRDKVHSLLEIAGVFRATEATTDIYGDSGLMIACVDRLVELKEIKEITTDNVMWQNKVFIKNS